MSTITERQLIAENIVRRAVMDFESAWWTSPSGDMMIRHIVELQCVIDDAIDLVADVHA